MREYRNMTSPSKAAYRERKCPKSTFILTANCPVYPLIQGKENRLFLRPFIAAKETGGLDFLIAYAPLILCHSLFKIVIKQISERGKIIVALCTVYTVIDCDIAHISFNEKDYCIVADFQIITP